jgi:hypothetical protein
MCDPVVLTDGQLLHLMGYGRDVTTMSDAELEAEGLGLQARLLADPDTPEAVRVDIQARGALPWEKPFDQWTATQIKTQTRSVSNA